MLQRGVAVGFTFLVLSGAAWTGYAYVEIKRRLRHEPLKLYTSSRVHLDRNELHMLFDDIDVDRDRALDTSEIVITMLGLKEIAAAFRGSHSASEIALQRGDCPHEVLEMIVLLRGNPSPTDKSPSETNRVSRLCAQQSCQAATGPLTAVASAKVAF